MCAQPNRRNVHHILFRSIPARAACLALGAAALGADAPAQQDPLFEAPWRAYATGEFPSYSAVAIAMGDLDGDQDLDALLAHDYYGAPGISVLLGRGDGSFGLPDLYSTAYNDALGAVGLADVDSDGDLDALATITGIWGDDNRVVYWPNRGDGSFAARRNFTTGSGPVGMVVADFTGDGLPDVVTANASFGAGSTISILKHNGLTGAQAGFLAAAHYPATPSVELVEAADLDGDGDLDLVAGGSSAQGHAVLFNTGGGAFSAPTLYPPATGYFYPVAAIALADLDRDGDVDLLGANASNGSPNYGVISVRENDGTGVFGADTLYAMDEWSWLPKRLASGDVNGDGWADVLAAAPTGRTMDGYHLLRNDGAGGLLPSQFYEAAKSTWDATVADVDADGDNDVLTCAYDSSVLTVHPNPGDGEFLVLERNLVGVLSSDMDHGDIDADGDNDLVTCDDSIRIVRGNGDGSFQPAVQFRLPMNPGSVKLRDMDSDGDLDLLIGADRNSPPYHFAVALNRGDGTFADAVITPVYASQAGDVEGIDFNNDGLRDVAVADPGPASANYIFRNNGNGTSYTYVLTLDHGSTQLAGADLEHDGNNDLLGNTAYGLTTWPGNGDFTFDLFRSEGFNAHPFEVTDLNGDGHHDLVMIMDQPSFGTITIGTVLGYGDGDFAFPIQYAGTSGREGAYRIAQEVHAADVTGDGWTDLILTSNAPCDVSVYPGKGDGTLAAPQRYGVGYQAGFTSPADFNGDGSIDLAVTMSLPPGGFQDAIVLLESTLEGNPGGLVLTQGELHRGQNAQFLVTGALAGERVYYLYSFTGVGAGPCPPQLGGLCLDLLSPVQLIGSAYANAGGQALLSVDIPAGAPIGQAVHTQAVARRGPGGAGSVKSNTVSDSILP
ncbi:MAG: VCBS repeat-containing protein [Planctomycetota bacterium]|nr:MAG: VCBS repeat-containing protein [Planctomycetota bacterium]